MGTDHRRHAGYGLAPGPRMLGDYAHLTIMIVVMLAVGNFLMCMVGLGLTVPLAKLTRVSYPAIGSLVLPLAIVSAFISSRLCSPFRSSFRWL